MSGFATFLGRAPDTATGEDIRRLAKLDTTALYARVATKTIRAVTSPIEALKLLMEGESPGT